MSSEELDDEWRQARYEELFGRARRYNRAHPEPNLYLDLCGYEYSTVTPDSHFVCAGCGHASRAVLGFTGRAHVAVDAPLEAFGRKHVPLGVVCDIDCATVAMNKFLDDGTEYRDLALRVAGEANAEFEEPIRLALLEVSRQRNDHWRRYVTHLRKELGDK